MKLAISLSIITLCAAVSGTAHAGEKSDLLARLGGGLQRVATAKVNAGHALWTITTAATSPVWIPYASSGPAEATSVAFFAAVGHWAVEFARTIHVFAKDAAQRRIRAHRSRGLARAH